jgi:hypothetical protein
MEPELDLTTTTLPFVAAARDDEGRIIVGLDARAAAAVIELLDALPLAHDMIEDGFSAEATSVAGLLQDALSTARACL